MGTTQVAADDVRARATGNLTRIAVREGDAFKKGDLLAEIDPRTYRLDLNAAKARLQVAQAKLQAVKLRADNSRKLLQNKVIGQDELALNLAAEAEAEATLLGAKVDVERAELTLSWTRVAAPFNGRVSRIHATEGGLVTADQTHILRIVATDPLYVMFNVPEAILLQLRRDGLSEPGKLSVAVGLAIDEGFPRAAKLDLIGLEVDPKTASAPFRATVENPKGLLSPGMSLRVRLTPAPR